MGTMEACGGGSGLNPNVTLNSKAAKHSCEDGRYTTSLGSTTKAFDISNHTYSSTAIERHTYM